MAINFSKLSVLVCEDNPSLKDVVCEVLKILGVGQVLSATNGQRGFDVFQEGRPDIVITDWEMEPGDGLSLIKNIRKEPHDSNRDVPIIILTGYAFHERITQARDMGVTEYLIKPFTAEGLMHRLTYVINNPRSIVDAPNFYGPDRRRKEGGFGGLDRRDD